MTDPTVVECRRIKVFLLSFAILAIIVVSGCSRDVANDLSPTCSGSLQKKIDLAAANSTLTVAGGCIYREAIVVEKPLRIVASNGAEIRGSDVWSEGWMRQDSSRWIRGTLPSLPSRSYCRADSQRCKWAEQVFFDGEPLTQVASDPTSGQFAVDSQRRVIIADDPGDHVVEVSVRRFWVLGKSPDVSIEGFTMKHAANDIQHSAAITNNANSGWTIEDNILSDAHGAVVSMNRADDLKLISNDISRGGQLGVHSFDADLLLHDNQIHHNNTEGFDSGWESGGMKSSTTRRLVASSNKVYANDGKGLWCDVECKNMKYFDNRIHDNRYSGIFIEVSENAQVYDNVLYRNGFAFSSWGWGGAIVSSSSRDVEIHDNVLAWNADGVSVISQRRADLPQGGVSNVVVHHNTILSNEVPSKQHNFSLSWLEDYEGTMFSEGSHNRGYSNSYYYDRAEGSSGTPDRFEWDGAPMHTLRSFNLTPGEQNGRYISNSQKNSQLASEAIPSS